MNLCKQLPVTVNVEGLATGVIEMTLDLSDATGVDYMAAMKFGMLPTPLMDMLKKELTNKFCETFKVEDPATKVTRLIRVDSAELFDELEFTVNELVSEILHDVSLKIYSIVPMVV